MIALTLRRRRLAVVTRREALGAPSGVYTSVGPQAASGRSAAARALESESDRRLVELARAGHDGAFEAIVRRYRQPLLRYSRGLLPPERAEEAVQETFINAFRSIMRTGVAPRNARAWLFRIARNASVTVAREPRWTGGGADEDDSGVAE